MPDHEETPDPASKFDFSAFPEDIVLHERRDGRDRRAREPVAGRAPKGQPRAKRERRRRIDPTTFEKQYTDDELEFMTAMQQFKVQSGKAFPTHGEVLKVAYSLGYRKLSPVIAAGPDVEAADPTVAAMPLGCAPASP